MNHHSALAVSTRRASEALIDLLGRITSARHQNVRIDFPAAKPPVDLLARVTVANHSHTLACALLKESLEATLLSLTRATRALGERVRPVLIAAELDHTEQALCRESGVDFIDMAGNARLSLDDIFSSPEPVQSLPASLLVPPPAGLSNAAA